MEELHPVGALCKTPEEADPRDYQSEYVLGEPDLSNLPRKVDLIGIMEETRNQGAVGSCTAMAVCHTMLSMNILDHNRNDIFIDYKHQRTVNQGKQRIANSGGDYLENACRTLKNNGIKGTIGGEDFHFEIDGYAVHNRESDFEKFIDIAMWNMSQGRPIYWCFYGNAQTRRECTAGEITTVWSLKDGGTGGHAIEWAGIDKDRRKVKFANSWRWNSKNNDDRLSISSFEIDFDVFEQLLKNNVFNYRYWVLFDKKDMVMDKLFDDFTGYNEHDEAYQAVKRAKEAGVIKGSNGGKTLEPNRPMTRLEMLLVLYRLHGKE